MDTAYVLTEDTMMKALKYVLIVVLTFVACAKMMKFVDYAKLITS